MCRPSGETSTKSGTLPTSGRTYSTFCLSTSQRTICSLSPSLALSRSTAQASFADRPSSIASFGNDLSTFGEASDKFGMRSEPPDGLPGLSSPSETLHICTSLPMRMRIWSASSHASVTLSLKALGLSAPRRSSVDAPAAFPPSRQPARARRAIQGPRQTSNKSSTGPTPCASSILPAVRKNSTACNKLRQYASF